MLVVALIYWETGGMDVQTCSLEGEGGVIQNCNKFESFRNKSWDASRFLQKCQTWDTVNFKKTEQFETYQVKWQETKLIYTFINYQFPQ